MTKEYDYPEPNPWEFSINFDLESPIKSLWIFNKILITWPKFRLIDKGWLPFTVSWY